MATRFDWDDAPDVYDFYGRTSERLQLEQWILQERCRLVSVFGMGGIGKSSLAAMLMHEIAPAFQVVIFRSVRDALPCQDLLVDCLQVLAPEVLPAIPPSLERRLDLLLECFQKYRCLFVLDNLESLLQEHDPQGHYLSGCEEYGVLLRRVVETAHQSCLLLTSRELPPELEYLEQQQVPLRSLRLAGLETAACEQLLEQREATGTEEERARLVALYAGNPLALKIVAETIADLFGGEIGAFLEQGEAIFSNIRDLLEAQFSRLTTQEQAVLIWLAIVREPLTLEALLPLFVFPTDKDLVKKALAALQRHSLVERVRQQETYSLQSVVQQYAIETLIERSCAQIQSGTLDYLIIYAFEQAKANEYVRQTQTRLIVAPIVLRLRSSYQRAEAVEMQLFHLLDQLREWEDFAQGYGPANLIALLRELRGHLWGVDLSRLSLRGAYLQGVELHDASLVEANLHDTIFTEDFDAIWAVAVSRQGRYWAAGSRLGKVRVWREEGRLLHLAWQAHTDTTYTLAFSPDERTLATASLDGTVKLWDLEHGDLLWTGQHMDLVRSVAFSPGGHLLASGANDGTIQLWNPASGALVQTLTDEGGAVYTLDWSPVGHLLASSSFDRNIRLWQIQKPAPAPCVQVLSGHAHWILGLAFAPDGASLASGSWDKTVKLWDVSSGGLLQTLKGHTERIYTVAWSPDGRTIASAGFDKIIWLWDVEHGHYRAACQGHASVIYKLAFTPDSNRLLSGSDDGALGVWDIHNGQCVRMMKGYAVSFYDLSWSPTGTHLVTGDSDMLVTIWDIAGKTQPKVLRGHRWTVLGVAWSPADRLLASSGRDNAIRVWDTVTGSCLQILHDPDYTDTIFYSITWSPDGRFLASGGYMRGVQVWNVETGQRCWVGLTHPTRIRCVTWSPDGSRVASCGDDGGICLWRASDGALLTRWQQHQSAVICVAWSPDGKRLASGGGGRRGGELFVWNVDSGEIVQRLVEQAESVFALAWSPNGEVLISGGSDGCLRWWEVGSGKCLMMRQEHQGTVQSLRVSPDGHLLASSGDDSTIRLWDRESGELVRTLRRDRPYERLNITGIKGLTAAQKTTLHALGAFEIP